MKEQHSNKILNGKKVEKTCGWCEIKTFVTKDTLVCPNCNKQGY